jgi:AcrR family transcriptional regulator
VRERLVAAGAALVAEQGSAAISLREIARRAGVSHGAPRRYFPTHRHLLAAVAGEGYRELASLIDAADTGGPARTRLLILGREFLDFAHARRGMFELMFRHDLLSGTDTGLREASLPLFRRLVDLVAQASPHLDGAQWTVRAGSLWANLYGIAQLWQWRSLQLATGGDDVALLLRAAIDAHVTPAPDDGAARDGGVR